MIRYLLVILLIIFPCKAEIIKTAEKHKHLGNVSVIDSCKIAEQKAKKKAIIQTLGQTVSSEVLSKCSEIDGEYDCERNQLSLFELNGDITSYKIIDKKDGKEDDSNIRFCEVTIEANVVPIKKNQDPTFQFDVKLNQKIFRSKEKLEIKINTSKAMYINIFQWLPYGGKEYNKITKIFPNENFNIDLKNLIKDEKFLEYEVYFPEQINKNKVDEYLIFVASEKSIPWLNEYTQIEGLKSQINRSKMIIEKQYRSYIVIQ